MVLNRGLHILSIPQYAYALLVCLMFSTSVAAQEPAEEYLRSWNLYTSAYSALDESDISYNHLLPFLTDTLNWKSIQSSTNIVDLMAFREAETNRALIMTTINSTRDQEVFFRLGSQGGARVWINGEQVFQVDQVREYEHDADFFISRLNKGANQVVAWIQMWEGDFGWSLSNPLAPDAWIYGQIRNNEGTIPASIELMLSCGSASFKRTAVGENGVYGIRVLEGLEDCRLSARAGNLGDQLDLPESITSSLRNDLIVRPAQFARGSVLLKDGKTPLEGLLLEVEEVHTGRVVATGVSQELGHFQLGPLPAGRYKLRYESPWGRQYVSTKGAKETGDVFRVTANNLNELDNLNFLVPEFAKGNWTHFTTLDGLPHHIVDDVEIDSDGTLLCGTRGGGFCKFDGTNFEVMGVHRGLKSNIVYDVDQSGPGEYLLATAKGVIRFDYATKYVTGIFDVEQGLPHDNVNRILVDRDGVVWAGTDMGLAKIRDGSVFPFSFNDALPSKTILTLKQDSNGIIWIGTRLGAAFFDGRDIQIVEETLGLRVFDVMEDNAGSIWFATNHGLYSMVPDIGSVLERKHDLQLEMVTSVCESRDGRIWVGADNRVSVLSGQHLITYPQQASNEGIPIRSLNCNEASVIWIGTENGLMRLDFTINTFAMKDGLLKTDFPDEKAGVYDVLHREDDSWYIGTGWGGLYQLKDNRLTHLYPDEQLYVRRLKSINARDVWLSTNNGPVLYADSTATTFPVEAWTHAVLTDDTGNLWTGQGWNGNGIRIYDRVSSEFVGSLSEEDGLPDNHVWALEKGQANQIWIGTDKGIGLFEDDQLRNITVERGLEECTIFDIHASTNEEAWFASSCGVFRLLQGKWSHFTREGIFLLDRDEWRLVNASLKLTDDVFWSVYKTEDGITWMGAQSRGLIGYDGKAYTFLDSRSGLIGNQVIGIDSDRDGNLLVGTLDGGLSFYKMEKRNPQFFLDEVKTGGSTYDDEVTVLDSKTNQLIELTYSEVDLYTPANARQFFIQIRDEDNKPVETLTTRSRTFNWSPDEPGVYLVSIQYLDRQFNYSEPEEVSIRVSYPLIQNPFFYIPALLLMVGFLGFTARLRSNYASKKEEAYVLREEMLNQAQDAKRNLEIKNELLLDANRQAEEAKAIAEEAAMAKSLFLSKMSHELRTPMNGVIGMASLLSSTPLDDEQQELVSIIMSSGDSLVQLINDILDFSKIEANKLELEFLETDLRSVIEETLDLIAATIIEKPVQLSYFMPETLPDLFLIDVTRIKQILLNLLSNATKFTEKGEVTLEVGAREINDGRWEIITSIKDTGIGIPADRMDRLFASFSQVDESITRRYGGSGLGLSISKQLSELMGGSLWVKSEVGVGSDFSFSIIAETVKPDSDANPVNIEHVHGKVLVVGFDGFETKMLKHHIEAIGLTAESPVKGGDVNMNGEYDLIVFNRAMGDIEQVLSPRTGETLPPVLHVCNRCLDTEEIAVQHTLFRPIKPVWLQARVTDLIHHNTENPGVNPQTEPGLNLSVMVVDERVLMLKIASRMLEKLGCDVVSVKDVRGIEAYLDSKEVDLILLHSEEPVAEMIERVKKIKKISKKADLTPLWVANNSLSETERKKLAGHGVSHVIAIPYEKEELVPMIEDQFREDSSEKNFV